MLVCARLCGLIMSVSAVHAAETPRVIASSAFPEPRSAPFADRGSEARVAAYREAQEALELRRVEFAARYKRARGPKEKAAVLDEAADLANRSMVDLVEPWIGTPWNFYGTSEEPGRGTIACGYFVTTLLRDSAVRVERVKLAQQASEKIVKTLAPKDRVWRFRSDDVEEVLKTVRAQPERWFSVGLDLHTGLLLRLDDGRVLFCHSSFLEPQAAICEDAATAPAMASNYHVVGALFTRELTRKWLEGERVATSR